MGLVFCQWQALTLAGCDHPRRRGPHVQVPAGLQASKQSCWVGNAAQGLGYSVSLLVVLLGKLASKVLGEGWVYLPADLQEIRKNCSLGNTAHLISILTHHFFLKETSDLQAQVN